MKHDKQDIRELYDSFEDLQRAFDVALPKTPLVKIVQIRYSGKRLKTALHLLKCAFQILFTGQTIIKYQKRSNDY